MRAPYSPDFTHMNDTTPAIDAGRENAGAENVQDLPQDFETALAQLEALVGQMENGALPLDQSIAAYEKVLNWRAFANAVWTRRSSRSRCCRAICSSHTLKTAATKVKAWGVDQ